MLQNSRRNLQKKLIHERVTLEWEAMVRNVDLAGCYQVVGKAV